MVSPGMVSPGMPWQDSRSPDSQHDGPPIDATLKTDTGGGGTILLQENFEDSNFSQRGWYDAPKGTLTTAAKEGKSAFECLYKKGAKGCAGGTPGRHAITPSESLYVSYWVKYSANFVGSGKPTTPTSSTSSPPRTASTSDPHSLTSPATSSRWEACRGWRCRTA